MDLFALLGYFTVLLIDISRIDLRFVFLSNILAAISGKLDDQV